MAHQIYPKGAAVPGPVRCMRVHDQQQGRVQGLMNSSIDCPDRWRQWQGLSKRA